MNRILYRYQPGLPVTVKLAGQALEVGSKQESYGVLPLDDAFPLEMTGPWEGLLQVVQEGVYLGEGSISVKSLDEWLSTEDATLRLVFQHSSDLKPVDEFTLVQGRLEIRGCPGLREQGNDWRWEAAFHLPCHTLRIYTQGVPGCWEYQDQPGTLSIPSKQEHQIPLPVPQDRYNLLASLIPTQAGTTPWGLPKEAIRMSAQGLDWFRINLDSSQNHHQQKGV